MKNKTKASLRLILAGMMTMILTIGCTSYQKANIGLLTTEQQVCRLKSFTHLRENDSEMGISADIPVEGPQSLIDSVTVFFNEELYRYFDNGENIHVPYERVFSTDLANLTNHYRKIYTAFYDENNLDVTEFNTHWLELNLAAQTETFVTYEVVWNFMGEGLEQARSWTTFVKKDGHRLKEVISTENMLRFFQDHPETRDSGVWENVQWKLAHDGVFWLDNVGLLTDSLALQYFWNMGIFDDFFYDLRTIKPYLSKEAQELVPIM